MRFKQRRPTVALVSLLTEMATCQIDETPFHVPAKSTDNGVTVCMQEA
jgi:hypothetical protein